MLNTLRHIARHPLNRNQLLRALVRYAQWQMATRLLPQASFAMPLTASARLLVRPGMHGATQNVYCGLNDFSEMGFLLHCLRPGDVFVDVGANVGAYTILASTVTKALTYSFEPSKTALEALRDNVLLNDLSHLVQIKPVALGRACGTSTLSSGGSDAMHHISYPTEPGSLSVEMRTLDSYNLRPTILKLDVEGYEAEVIGGAQSSLQCKELIAVITENSDWERYNGTPREVDDSLKLLGFQPATYDPTSRALTEQTIRADNTIYVRDIENVRYRLQCANYFRVLDKCV